MHTKPKPTPRKGYNERDHFWNGHDWVPIPFVCIECCKEDAAYGVDGFWLCTSCHLIHQ